MHYLKDFKELEWSTPEASIEFQLGKKSTKVRSTYKVQSCVSNPLEPLFFNGENLSFKGVWVEGEKLLESEYTLNDKGLTLLHPPEKKIFEVCFENEINPSENLELEGLYVSGPMLCTQNEPMGFRKITYAIDRPDNMVKVQTKLVGSLKEFPVMLSNGNAVEKGSEGEKHHSVWQDPFPKPLYLFAVVAGDLAKVTDTYTTSSGKKVDIEFYCDHGAESKCSFAVQALKDSMKWDEDRFNLEYDLDLYMVVAADSFNMGAMENKGLNIFNSSLVLASPKTATDTDYHSIEAVIGHEYFHNWTGNRVTLKNWFQLTLKEGLTVFRDQEFSADLNDRAVERIDMVKSLKSRQFLEDAGPLAHPIRPDQYKEMNNFYTATVYEKGAEVIRMFHTLLGEEKFQAAMEVYFKKYDGKAITTEDFINTMCEQDDRILKEDISKWYHTPGTPHVQITESWSERGLSLSCAQSNKIAETKNQGFCETYIPIKLSIYDEQGKKVELKVSSSDQPFLNQGILILKNKEHEVLLEEVPSEYQASYFEDFSAPVTFDVKSSTRNLSRLIRIDQNHFNKYNVFKKSALGCMENPNSVHVESFKLILNSNDISDLMKSHILAAPSFAEVIEGHDQFDPIKVNQKRESYLNYIGETCKEEILGVLSAEFPNYKYNLKDKGRRALWSALTAYIKAPEQVEKVYNNSDNMTLSFAALMCAQKQALPCAEAVSKDFYKKYKDQGLTLQKWIVAYLSCPSFEEMEKRVKKVQALEGFDPKVPNFIRSLWRGVLQNTKALHEPSGKGYKMVMEGVMEVDKINPQMSSGIMKGLSDGVRFSGPCGEAFKKEFAVMAAKKESFSSHLLEIFDGCQALFEDAKR